MSLVNITDIKVLTPEASFADEFQFEITFELIAELQDDLEWKVTYVGSPENQNYDQTLDSIMVGPVPPGTNKFLFPVPAPDPSKIPEQDIVGVTVVIISCSYREQEFVRVGYYVNNDYFDEELRENPPEKPILEKLQRTILAEKPKVTKYTIKWEDSDALANTPAQPAAHSDQVVDSSKYSAMMEDEPATTGEPFSQPVFANAPSEPPQSSSTAAFGNPSSSAQIETMSS